MDISAVVPTLNEASGIQGTVESLWKAGVQEVIVVDGGSQDDTIARARAAGARVVSAPRGRALQLNRGAQEARGSILWFVHGDTRVPPQGGRALQEALMRPGVVAGAFDLGIDSSRWALQVVARVASWRTRLTRVPYGDQALFVRREAFEAVGGYPPWPLMEDVGLALQLRRIGRLTILPLRVWTSPRRWEREGIVYTTLRNWFLLTLFFLGMPPEHLRRWYPDTR